MERSELVVKSNGLEQEVSIAQAQQDSELQLLFTAEHEVQEARGIVDKLHKQRQAGDRVVEDAEGRVGTRREVVAQYDEQIAQQREEVARLQGEIAESPEGLEQEIQELQLGIRQFKARLE